MNCYGSGEWVVFRVVEFVENVDVCVELGGVVVVGV